MISLCFCSLNPCPALVSTSLSSTPLFSTLTAVSEPCRSVFGAGRGPGGGRSLAWRGWLDGGSGARRPPPQLPQPSELAPAWLRSAWLLAAGSKPVLLPPALRLSVARPGRPPPVRPPCALVGRCSSLPRRVSVVFAARSTDFQGKPRAVPRAAMRLLEAAHRQTHRQTDIPMA